MALLLSLSLSLYGSTASFSSLWRSCFSMALLHSMTLYGTLAFYGALQLSIILSDSPAFYGSPWPRFLQFCTFFPAFCSSLWLSRFLWSLPLSMASPASYGLSRLPMAVPLSMALYGYPTFYGYPAFYGFPRFLWLSMAVPLSMAFQAFSGSLLIWFSRFL